MKNQVNDVVILRKALLDAQNLIEYLSAMAL